MGVLQDNPRLAERFRRGDRDALRRVYQAFVDDVEAVVRGGFTLENPQNSYVPGPEDEEQCKDLIQECFVRAFSEKARQRYDGDRPYRPYLLRIVKNRMVDRARTSDRIVLVEEDDDRDDVGNLEQIIEANRAVEYERSRAPEEQLHWKRLQEAVDTFIGDLEEEQRRFVELRYREGLSQRDVADRMDVSRRRVRTLQKWVRGGLRTFLEERDLLTREET